MTRRRHHPGDPGPALFNLSELNAAGPETLFALHGLLDRHQALELSNGRALSASRRCPDFRDGEPDRLRLWRYPDPQQGLRDRWIIWEKGFPAEDELIAMIDGATPA